MSFTPSIRWCDEKSKNPLGLNSVENSVIGYLRIERSWKTFAEIEKGLNWKPNEILQALDKLLGTKNIVYKGGLDIARYAFNPEDSENDLLPCKCLKCSSRIRRTPSGLQCDECLYEEIFWPPAPYELWEPLQQKAVKDMFVKLLSAYTWQKSSYLGDKLFLREHQVQDIAEDMEGIVIRFVENGKCQYLLQHTPFTVKPKQQLTDASFSAFKEWTTVYPGKMGLAWRRSWLGSGTKKEAEAEAAKSCNVVAVPLQLCEHLCKSQQPIQVVDYINFEMPPANIKIEMPIPPFKIEMPPPLITFKIEMPPLSIPPIKIEMPSIKITEPSTLDSFMSPEPKSPKVGVFQMLRRIVFG